MEREVKKVENKEGDDAGRGEAGWGRLHRRVEEDTHTPNHADAERAKWERVGGNETQDETRCRWRGEQEGSDQSSALDPTFL